MLRVNARQGAPTGGNSVIESLLVSSVFFFALSFKYFSLESYFSAFASFSLATVFHVY